MMVAWPQSGILYPRDRLGLQSRIQNQKDVDPHIYWRVGMEGLKFQERTEHHEHV
jgi:hypothetical protein